MTIFKKAVLFFITIVLWVPYSYAGVTITSEPNQFANLSVIDTDKIKEVISQSLSEKTKAENISVEIKGFEDGIKINSKHDSYEVDIADSSVNTNSRRFKYLLIFKSGNDSQKIDVMGKYEEIVKVPVFTSKMEHSATIAAEDIEYIESPKNKLQPGTIMDIDNLTGKTLKHTMPAGRPIRNSDLDKRIIISRGKAVKIVYKTPAITVQALGTAMDSGDKGEVIRVRNSTSDKIVQGTIENEEMVIVSSGL